MCFKYAFCKQRTFDSHKTTLNRETIVNNIKILRIKNDTYLDPIYRRGLLIRKLQPSINKKLTSTHRTLKLFNNY